MTISVRMGSTKKWDPEQRKTVETSGISYYAPSVQELQARGYRVLVRHERKYHYRWMPLSEEVKLRVVDLKPNGGKTFVRILAPDGTYCEGTAKCAGSDTYCRRTGYIMATFNALTMGRHIGLRTMLINPEGETLMEGDYGMYYHRL